jgi:NADH:ubiquinone reductase (H+-translocating)
VLLVRRGGTKREWRLLTAGLSMKPRPDSSAGPPRVVIVGAGFAGLAVARKLASAPADILVIDRQNYHLFQPLLYQVATAGLSPADIAAPIRSLLSATNTSVLLDEVVDIDPAARQVRMNSGGEQGYDVLVLAPGSEYNYFGHDEWRERAPGLKSLDDATDIRRNMLLAFERAEMARNSPARARLLTFVLIGAGPTGVELAGALVELARTTLSRDFRNIDPGQTRIVLIEAGSRVLAGFPRRLSDYAERSLRQMGIEILLDSPVERIDSSGVSTRRRTIDAGTVVWCAGVKARPITGWLGVPSAHGGRIEVAADLSVPDRPEIFVVGDAALCHGPDRRPLPGLAAVAKQQGEYVGEVVRRRLCNEPAIGPFSYRDRGTLATIGRNSAVADLPWAKLTGTTAWLLWGAVHIFLLIGFRNRIAVFLNWVWAWLTYGRGARLITGKPHTIAQAHQTSPASPQSSGECHAKTLDGRPLGEGQRRGNH